MIHQKHIIFLILPLICYLLFIKKLPNLPWRSQNLTLRSPALDHGNFERNLESVEVNLRAVNEQQTQEIEDYSIDSSQSMTSSTHFMEQVRSTSGVPDSPLNKISGTRLPYSEVGLDTKERFEKRRNHLEGNCENAPEEDVSYTINRRYFIFHEQKVGVCRILKSGSTTWRVHLRHINSGPPKTVPIFEEKRHMAFLNRSEKQILKDIGSHVRIITVRHPLMRLVSVWHQKYKGGKAFRPYDELKEAKTKEKRFMRSWSYLFQKYWVSAMASNGLLPNDIHTKLGLTSPLNTGPDQEYPLWIYRTLQNMLNPTINFNQFLNHVVKTFNASAWPATANDHWNVYWQECSPCSLRYDYITKLETMTEDLEYIFTHTGIPANPASHNNPRKHNKDDPYSYLSYYTQVPLVIRKDIYMIYKLDMDMFGYDLPDWFLTEEAK